MSAGDTKYDDKPASLAKLRALLLRYPAVGRRLRRERMVCFGFDIPYLGGISQNGRYVYIDRHLPDKSDGVPLAKYIEVHESVEQALVQVAKLSYEDAHHLATAAEQYAVALDGYEWEKYEGSLRGEFAPVEHEKVVRVPPDLDLYPYEGELCKHLASVAAQSQFTKDEVRYREANGATNRCGNCAMFLPRLGKCTWVAGHIEADDVCDKWEGKK